MRIGLIGYGRMGRLVEQVALREGAEVAERFTAARPLRADDEVREQLRGVSALVDFSTGAAVLETVRAAARLPINLVIGTTGWEGSIDDVRETVERRGIGVVYGSNFSLGVNLFYALVDEAARTLLAHGYDPFIAEAHHKGKKDRPSGTAIELQRLVGRYAATDSIETASLRAGHIPGTHLVGFDSAADTIRLEHSARGREGFAEGALRAARWIEGRKGFHPFAEVIGELESGSGGSP